MNTYEIKTVDDFLKVPADKIELCLQEFKEFCDYGRSIMELASAGADILGIDLGDEDFKFKTFTWIDDGKRDVTIRFTTKVADNGPDCK